MDERKKAARDARRAANEQAKQSRPALRGTWNDWRIVGGGVTMVVKEEYDPEKEEQERLKIELIDKMYQETLARKLRKVQEHTQKEIAEFEKAIRVVRRQIELQKAKEAKIRRKQRVKTEPSGVLICGDILEKITVPADPPQKRVSFSWETKMDSIVTVKIESGQSVQVILQGSTEPARIERGPQVLILSSVERLVGATFPLTARNASFKPEFNWHVSAQADSPSLSSPSHSYSLPFDSYTSPEYSHSFSFDSPTPSSALYDIPGALDTTPSYSFSFETDDASQNGNQYSFADESPAPQYGFVVRDDDDASEGSETLELRLARLLDLQTAHNRLLSVHEAGFMPDDEFNRQLDELLQGTDPTELSEEIERIQKEIEERNTIQRSAQRSDPDESAGNDAQEDAGHAERGMRGGRGGGLRGRGGVGMERGGRGRMERGGRGGRGGIGAERGGRGGAGLERGGRGGTGMTRGRGGIERGGRVMVRGGGPPQPPRASPSEPTRGRGRGRGTAGTMRREERMNGGRGINRERAEMNRGRGRMRGPGGMAGRIARRRDDISDISMNDSDDESVASEVSSVMDFGGRQRRDFESEIRTNIQKCQILLNFLTHFMAPKEIEAHPKLLNYIRGIFTSPDKEQEEGEKTGEEEKQGEFGGENPNGTEHTNGNVYGDDGTEHRNEGNEKGKGKGKGKVKEEHWKDDQDLDYLSSSMFLTDDEDGHYYERVEERRKKPAPQSKYEKALFIPVDKHFMFAQIEILPPRRIKHLAKSIDAICTRCESYNEELYTLRNAERLKAEEREKRKQKKLEEKELAAASPWAATKEKAEGEGEGEEKSEGEDGSHDSQSDGTKHSDAEDADADAAEEDAWGGDGGEEGEEEYANGGDGEGEEQSWGNANGHAEEEEEDGEVFDLFG